jgi:hypothetical protein
VAYESSRSACASPRSSSILQPERMSGPNVRTARAAALTAFEAALAASPSTALTYILGSVILGWTGEAERAIEWGERAMRLSPFDPWAFAAFHSVTLAYFQRGRFKEGAKAAYRSVLSNPAHSISYCWRRRSRRGQGCRSASFAIATCFPLQPPIFRRGLRAGTCGLSKRGAPRHRAAGITLRFIMLTR